MCNSIFQFITEYDSLIKRLRKYDSLEFVFTFNIIVLSARRHNQIKMPTKIRFVYNIARKLFHDKR